MANAIQSSGVRDAVQQSRQRKGLGAAWLDALVKNFKSGIERHENLVLIVALTVLTAFSLLFGWREPFRVDEYLVRITALSGSPTAVWHILKTAPLAVDPPLYHFLNVYWLRLFGATEFSVRLPSIVAYTFMSFFLYRFVRRYTDAFTGLILLALCLQCGTFPYAYEARPYTLVLAAAAMALVCWAMIVEEGQKRILALAGLFLGIAIAVGSHWFGFLVLVPLAVGEAVRTWQKRRIDAAVWAVLTAGAATALAYLPLLKGASQYRALPWKGVELGDISESFRLVLEPCVFPFTLLLVGLVVGSFFFGPRPPRLEASRIPMPVFVCVAAFALVPFPGFLVGKLVSHAFQPRYALLCTIGLLPLVSLAVRDFARRSVTWMGLAILILGGYASFSHYRELSGMPREADASAFADARVILSNSDLPVVPSTDDLFLRLEAHGPASVRQRCVFPTDPSFVRLLHENTTFLMTEGLRRWTKLPIPDLTLFLSAHPRFYLVQAGSGQSWLLDRMLEEHADVKLQGTYARSPVYLIQVRH